MKRRQAYRNAVECIKKQMQPLAFDANVVQKDPNASPSMQKRAARYVELAETLKYFEAALQQRELL